MTFQSVLSEFVKSPGYIPFERYRAFKNQVREAEQPERFVDGDLIERWLDCSAEIKAEIAERMALGPDGIEQLTGIVDHLRRLH